MKHSGHVALLVELHHRLPAPGCLVGTDWAEAAVRVYWPLVHRLVESAGEGRAELLTVAVSPSWTAQALDPVARDLVRGAFDRLEARGAGGESGPDSALRQFACEEWGGDLLAALRRAGDSGAVELIPTTASPAWLPAFADQPGWLQAQVRLAADDHEARLGTRPQGLWLPHLAYVPGIESILAAAGLRYLGVSADLFRGGTLHQPADLFGMMVTPPGVAVFGVDPEPGRISAQPPESVVAAWRSRVEQAPRDGSSPPLGLATLSAQALAGPGRMIWFERVLSALAGSSSCSAITPARYLDRYPEGPVGRPGAAVGGLDWLLSVGSDLLERCRAATEGLADLVTAREALGPLGRRAVAQITRSLLAATAHDAAEIYGPPLSAAQARARAEANLARCAELSGSLQAGRLDPGRLALLEAGPPYLADLRLDHLVPG